MSKHLEDFLKRNRELAEAATPGPWFQGYWSGMCHKEHAHTGRPNCDYTHTRKTDGDYAKSIVSSGVTENMEICSGLPPDTAAFVSASRTSFPLALELLSMACEALEKIGYTQDVSPADPETGGPCRIATANSRNRRILEAQEALAALEEKAVRG